MFRVAPDYTGDRFSLVYYVTEGKVEPRSTAVFRPFETGTDWIDRERQLEARQQRGEEVQETVDSSGAATEQHKSNGPAL